MEERRTHRDNDRGQMVVFAALVMVAAVLMSIGVTQVGSAMLDRQRAHTAADAAALAGVAGGPSAAADLARRNGAILVSFGRVGSVVTVVVAVGSARARARAGNGP